MPALHRKKKLNCDWVQARLRKLTKKLIKKVGTYDSIHHHHPGGEKAETERNSSAVYLVGSEGRTSQSYLEVHIVAFVKEG